MNDRLRIEQLLLHLSLKDRKAFDAWQASGGYLIDDSVDSDALYWDDEQGYYRVKTAEDRRIQAEKWAAYKDANPLVSGVMQCYAPIILSNILDARPLMFDLRKEDECELR